MVSLTVGDVEGVDEWHLPTYDPHNENKYHYKLHSLDIYFWTQEDALRFLNGIRRVLPPAQCEILDEPAPPAHQSAEVFSVVQKLEQAALGDNTPGGQEQQQTNARPPLSAVPSAATAAPPQDFAPMAYNPAAPAAPEQIRHREKTPPPEDGGVNPLQQTLAFDAANPTSPGLAPSGLGPRSPALPTPKFQPPPGAPVFPGPPQTSVTSPGLPRTSSYNKQSYSNSGAAAAEAGEYAIHQQFYTPADGEGKKHKPKKEPRGKLEENTGRLERGVTGMLKKFDQKFG
jgi:hypothetical protein